METNYGIGHKSSQWQNNGKCGDKDPELFYSHDETAIRMAKKICSSCAVTDECLQYALKESDLYGVWGGLSPHDRRRLLLNQKFARSIC